MEATVCSTCGRGLTRGDDVLIPACVCTSCFGAALSSRNRTIVDYLESLDGPAVLVAPDHTILFSNSQFHAMLAKSGAEVDGRRIGEILECMYATTVGLCGETDACFMCDLRRFIGLSLLTGVKLPDFEIGIKYESGGRRTFKITTEKFNDAVLLVIQEAGRTHDAKDGAKENA